MLILGFESSAKTASVALCRDGELLAQYFQNSGLTHSRTLLPMAEDMLKNLGVTLAKLDGVAVAHGPGSFTGVRIGVSTVKGLAWAVEKKVWGVSTLEAMAFGGLAVPEDSVICCVMDARRGQVYNAMFEIKDEKPVRLCPDRALGLDELGEKIKKCRKSVFFVGDGAQLCYNTLVKDGIRAALAPETARYQSAWGVIRAAMDKPPVSADKLLPVYLRLSQAERERQEREK